MQPPFEWVDHHGQTWLVYDWRTVQGRRRRVPISDPRSEARAFVPVNGGPVLIYTFGMAAYREPLAGKILEDQLRFAKRLGASAGQRMDRNG